MAFSLAFPGDATDRTQETAQAQAIEASSNRLLGFTQTLTTYNKGKTRSVVVTPVVYAVDANGAMTSDGLREFIHDASGRLAKVRVMQDGEAASISYLHNALGQLVFKGEPLAEQTLPNQQTLGVDFITWLKKQFGWLFAQAQANTSIGTAYVYGDREGEIPEWAILGEYDNGSAKGKGGTETIWLPQEDGSAIPVGLYRNGKAFAIHTDHLGTPRVMKNEANEVVWQWPYSAFGQNKPTGVLKETDKPNQALTAEPLVKATNPAQDLELRFPGQYFDAETGLAYNLHRSYLAGQGRYTQADPIGLAGGSNRFAYADSSPILNADPIGLQSRGVPPPGGPGANLRWPSLGPSEPSPTYRTNEQSRSRGNLSETTANLLNTFSANANGPILMRTTRGGDVMFETTTASGTRLVWRNGPEGPRLDIYGPGGYRETIHQQPVAGMCLK